MLVIVMSEEILILRDLADEELNKLSEDILLELRDIYIRDGVLYRTTVKGLLEAEYQYKGFN